MTVQRAALEIVSEYVSALAAYDEARMDSLRSPEFVLDHVHGDAFLQQPMTAEETQEFWPAWFAAFPGGDYEVTRTIAAAEVVVTQWVFTGTHTVTLGSPIFEPPVEPSGQTVQFRGVSIYDVSDGALPHCPSAGGVLGARQARAAETTMR